jgi:hypothetical protein
MVSNI